MNEQVMVLKIHEGAWDSLDVMIGVAISYMMWQSMRQSLCFYLICGELQKLRCFFPSLFAISQIPSIFKNSTSSSLFLFLHALSLLVMLPLFIFHVFSSSYSSGAPSLHVS